MLDPLDKLQNHVFEVCEKVVFVNVPHFEEPLLHLQQTALQVQQLCQVGFCQFDFLFQLVDPHHEFVLQKVLKQVEMRLSFDKKRVDLFVDAQHVQRFKPEIFLDYMTFNFALDLRRDHIHLLIPRVILCLLDLVWIGRIH